MINSEYGTDNIVEKIFSGQDLRKAVKNKPREPERELSEGRDSQGRLQSAMSKDSQTVNRKKPPILLTPEQQKQLVYSNYEFLLNEDNKKCVGWAI